MRRIIDLTYPIEDHFRWKVEREPAAAFERGDDFQITRLSFATPDSRTSMRHATCFRTALSS